MPPRLSKSMRLSIDFMFLQLGYSIKKISKITKKDKKTIKRWLNTQGFKDKARTPTKLTLRLRRRVMTTLRRTNSLIQTGKSHTVSHSFVWKIARRSKMNPNGIFPYKKIKQLKINRNQLTKRLKFLKKRRITLEELRCIYLEMKNHFN